MEEKKYPPSGSLFSNEQKRSENSPDYSGYLEIDDEVYDDLLNQKSKNSEKISMSLVGKRYQEMERLF